MGIGNSIALGTITGCFGGVVRDVLSGSSPLIFRKEIYATASIMGGLIYTGFLILFDEGILIQVIAFVSTIGIRFAVYHYQIRLTQFSDKTAENTPSE